MDIQDSIYQALFGKKRPAIVGTTSTFSDDLTHSIDAMRYAIHGLESIPKPFKLVVSKWMTNKTESRQYRFPNSKKKRIRTKWARNEKYYRMSPVYEILVDKENAIMYGTQQAIDRITKYFNNGTLRRR